jgi:hypothetical protein
MNGIRTSKKYFSLSHGHIIYLVSAEFDIQYFWKKESATHALFAYGYRGSDKTFKII